MARCQAQHADRVDLARERFESGRAVDIASFLAQHARMTEVTDKLSWVQERMRDIPRQDLLVIAERTGISLRTLQRFKTGSPHSPRYEHVATLYDLLSAGEVMSDEAA